MKIGVALLVRPSFMHEVAIAADCTGYESVWAPDHLVLPASLGAGSPVSGDDHLGLDPGYPYCDNVMVLATLAMVTEQVRLGTWAYNLALRHPFVSGRAFSTLDICSNGRAILGVGTGWVRAEFEAVGVAFAGRGRRTDECIDILRKLWHEAEPAHEGACFRFDPVRFEPKPVQDRLPILVAGDSNRALRRVVERGDGWLGSWHTVESAAERIAALSDVALSLGRNPGGLEITVGAQRPDIEECEAYARAGVDRLIVCPWTRSEDALAGVRTYAEEVVSRIGSGVGSGNNPPPMRSQNASATPRASSGPAGSNH